MTGSDDDSTDHEKRQVLFDDDEEDDSDNDQKKKFQINKKFATEYTNRKQQEEYRRVVQFEGVPDDNDDGSSSESSSEDEDGDLLTTAVDVEIFKTINALRSKDKKIYDPNAKFFSSVAAAETGSDSDSDDDDGKARQKKSKPKRYKDVLREQVLDKINEGKDAAESDDEQAGNSEEFESTKTSRLAYDAQQQELRKEFLDNADGESDEDNLMVVRTKNGRAKADDDGNDEETRQRLLDEMQKLEESVGDTKLEDPKGEVQDGQKFLLEYFKNQAWTERGDDESSDEEVPGKPPRPTKPDNGHESDEDSIDQVDRMDNFEAEYNFRFEQAAAAGGDAGAAPSGADFSVIGYARGQTMNTLRRKDDSRRDKRLARQERKAAERKAKEEQLKRLKNAKKQEMDAKLKQIKAVLGDMEENSASAPVDEATILKLMEGDFDPDKFEELMKEAYSDDFYQQQDAEWKTDQDVRETLKKDEDGALLVGQDDDGGLYDNDEENEYEGGYDEEEYDGMEEEEEEWPEEEGYAADGNDGQKPESELEQKVKAKMMDELYKLDYEDIIAGMPTRFKYRTVEANTYGLSTEEILFSRDTTLKQFVSLKKMAPYNDQGEFHADAKRRRRFREMLKRDLQEQEAQPKPQDESSSKSKTSDDADVVEDDGGGKKKKRRRLRKSKRTEKDEPEEKVAAKEDNAQDDNGNDDVIEPKTKKRRRKKKKVETEEAEPDDHHKKDESNKAEASTTEMVNPEKNKKKKDKKKKKEKKTSIEGVPESRLASYGF